MKQCPKCLIKHEMKIPICQCGYQFQGDMMPKAKRSLTPHVKSRTQATAQSTKTTRYPMLRSIATFFRAMAAVTVLAGLSAVALFEAPIEIRLGALFMALLLCAVLLAFAESVQVIVDIEHNTRLSAELRISNTSSSA